jgi:CO dehydrogenase maturation factor
MPVTIAISGKGGVGKTTISALLIRRLNDLGITSILAVDADANVNLNDLLGVESGESIGTIREEMRAKIGDVPGGMTKQQFLEYKIHSSLLEDERFDLITMGRPEGPGCYCYANSLLRDILKSLEDNYEFVIIDNEAGMEHLSRRTVQKIDYLLIVSDPTVRGVQTAGRISRLIKELDTRVDHKYLVINRVREELSEQVKVQISCEGLKVLCTIPEDDSVYVGDMQGQSVYDLARSSPSYAGIADLWQRIKNENVVLSSTPD